MPSRLRMYVGLLLQSGCNDVDELSKRQQMNYSLTPHEKKLVNDETLKLRQQYSKYCIDGGCKLM